jgi:hypothetical protein
MSRENLIEALKQVEFKELINLYLESKTGTPINYEVEFNSYDIQQVEDLDTTLFVKIAMIKAKE